MLTGSKKLHKLRETADAFVKEINELVDDYAVNPATYSVKNSTMPKAGLVAKVLKLNSEVVELRKTKQLSLT